MNSFRTFGFFCVLILVTLPGICGAEETPLTISYIQGGDSVIADGIDGMMEITVHNVVPYYYYTKEEHNVLLPINGFTTFPCPFNAAIIFSANDNTTISMIKVSNLTISDDNKIITMAVTPLTYYDEGQGLSSFADKYVELTASSSEGSIITQIYAETRLNQSENDYGCDCCVGWSCYQCPNCGEWPNGCVTC